MPPDPHIHPLTRPWTVNVPFLLPQPATVPYRDRPYPITVNAANVTFVFGQQDSVVASPAVRLCGPAGLLPILAQPLSFSGSRKLTISLVLHRPHLFLPTPHLPLSPGPSPLELSAAEDSVPKRSKSADRCFASQTRHIELLLSAIFSVIRITAHHQVRAFIADNLQSH